MSDLHVIYTDPGDPSLGWDISGPQIVGLVAGRRNVEEALRDTPYILDFAGYPEGSYNLIQHEQKYAESPSGHGFFLRFAASDDARADDRYAVIGRELHAVESGHMDEDIDRMPTTPGGDRIIIAAVPEDTLGWVLDQLGSGEGAVAAYYAGEDAIYSLPIFDEDREGGKGSKLEALGLDRESTVGEAVGRVMAQETNRMAEDDARAFHVYVERLALA